jgi:hypothetical protein
MWTHKNFVKKKFKGSHVWSAGRRFFVLYDQSKHPVNPKYFDSHQSAKLNGWVRE